MRCAVLFRARRVIFLPARDAILLPARSAFRYQDAFVHAATLAALAGPLLAYVAAIYAMRSQPEPVSAQRNGLFGDFRQRGAEKSD